MSLLTIAFVAGIFCGIAYGLVLLFHVLPYMRKDLTGGNPFAVNRAISEYYARDDSAERKTKILLHLLRAGFLLAVLLAAIAIVVAASMKPAGPEIR